MPDSTPPPRVTKNDDGSFSVNVHSYRHRHQEIFREVIEDGPPYIITTNSDGAHVVSDEQPTGEMPELAPLLADVKRVGLAGVLESGLVRAFIQLPIEQHKAMERRITHQRWELRKLNRCIVGMRHYADDMQRSLERARKERDEWRQQARTKDRAALRLAKQIEMLDRLLKARHAELAQADKRIAELQQQLVERRKWWWSR